MLEQDVASPCPLELRLGDIPCLVVTKEGLGICVCLFPFGIYFLLGNLPLMSCLPSPRKLIGSGILHS